MPALSMSKENPDGGGSWSSKVSACPLRNCPIAASPMTTLATSTFLVVRRFRSRMGVAVRLS